MILDETRRRVDDVLTTWLRTKGIETLPTYNLEEPPAAIEADLACNVALLLAKLLRQSPRAVATELQTVLAQAGYFESVTIAGAGFINLKLPLPGLQAEIREVLSQPATYGCLEARNTRKVLVEFVSANPTGPLHVGHGRGAALGDSLARILAYLGNQVTREFYVNDAGNQITLLGQSLGARVRETKGEPLAVPDEGYHGDYLVPVAQRYLAAHPDADGDLSKMTDFTLREMLADQKKDLEDFDVRFDSWVSEGTFVAAGKVDAHIQALRERGFVKEADGAIWFQAPEEQGDQEKDKDRVLKRRDGRWTYFATDVAYHADKFARGFEELIDIWGADHHGYVSRVKGSMQALGHDPKQLHVVLYQLVALLRNGAPVAMSKRSGDFVTLREVLDEVGKDACRFFFAMRGPNTALDFDLELAKKHSNENPVYYVQYAHARMSSIFRQAEVAGIVMADDVDVSFLKEKEERDLIKRLAFFAHALRVCVSEDSPHPLANYVLTLCRQFHHFYDHHRVLGEDVRLTQARLALLRAVRHVLKSGLGLLGVSAPEAM